MDAPGKCLGQPVGAFATLQHLEITQGAIPYGIVPVLGQCPGNPAKLCGIQSFNRAN